MKKILGFALLALLMLSLPAFAAGPTDTAPPTTTGAQTTVRSGFAGKSETTITGMVVGEDDNYATQCAALLPCLRRAGVQDTPGVRPAFTDKLSPDSGGHCSD